MNIWHDIDPRRVAPADFVAVVEIPEGSNKKYELDKQTGLLRLDRILYTSTHYPANYGFIPRTYADDSDPLDVLVLCSEPLDPMVMVECYPIGVVRMIDDDEIDDKVIAIPQHFFEVYKGLEHGHSTTSEVLGGQRAQEIIEECMERYQVHFCGKRVDN